VTLFLDDCTRAITGWAISLQPSSAEVLAALRDAILVNPERGPFGGLPGRLRWDHGLEFAATAVEQAALALGIDVDPATPYAPHEKGKIKRLHRTIADGFVAGLPAGPMDRVTSAVSSRARTNRSNSPSSWRGSTPGSGRTTSSARTAASGGGRRLSGGRPIRRRCD
jgi:putative transposase